jgi:hypothetical protein
VINPRQKPSSTVKVLNGVFGGVNRGRGRMCQKRAFVERLALWKQPLAVLFKGLGKTLYKKISERRVLYSLL